MPQRHDMSQSGQNTAFGSILSAASYLYFSLQPGALTLNREIGAAISLFEKSIHP